jgi:hypothetical protein
VHRSEIFPLMSEQGSKPEPINRSSVGGRGTIFHLWPAAFMELRAPPLSDQRSGIQPIL